ncbi:thioredoxin [Spiroplasma endosymbiont of Othius punctulatus]|uniref:thioredoxin n=1 Tax=Spiroplasma endosymbiont of Othius punctulatus TaxID=3066289 RepID=UPI0030D0E29B
MAITNITSMSQFENEIAENNKVFVSFFATWCGPCKMVEPFIEEIAKETKDVKFIEIDVDINKDIAEKFAIMSIPTMIIFENKEAVRSHTGFASKDMLNKFINQ